MLKAFCASEKAAWIRGDFVRPWPTGHTGAEWSSAARKQNSSCDGCLFQSRWMSKSIKGQTLGFRQANTRFTTAPTESAD